jgi:hypothetical protein
MEHKDLPLVGLPLRKKNPLKLGHVLRPVYKLIEDRDPFETKGCLVVPKVF